MKREYFIITENPIEAHGWTEMHARNKMIVFPEYEIRESPIFLMLIELAPRFTNMVHFRNLQLSMEEASKFRQQLLDWVIISTHDKPSAEPGEICSFKVGDRFVILNLRNVHDAYIYAYWRAWDILNNGINAGKPTLISLMDHT